jgi:MraZ protein
MFVGKAKHTINKDGRVSIPSKMRDVIKKNYESEDLYLILMPRNTICIYPEEEFDRLFAGMYNPEGGSLSEIMNVQRLCGEAESCRLDGSGRIVIPPEMRVKAKISSEVLVVGTGTHIEIWDPPRWDFNQDRIQEELEKMSILSAQSRVGSQEA